MSMEWQELFLGKKKKIEIGILMLLSFFILLPSAIKIINLQVSPYTENEVVITTVSYKSQSIDPKSPYLIVGNLFQPAPKFSNDTYPAILFCHGNYLHFGKEMLNHWAIELTKRGFVVLAVDLAGNGMSLGKFDFFPRVDVEPAIILDGIHYLESLDFVMEDKIGILGYEMGANAALLSAGKFSNHINATISINGMINVSRWIIEKFLPKKNIEFEVFSDKIELKAIEGKSISHQNIKMLLQFYKVFNGEASSYEEMIIPGTSSLNRSHLKKFDVHEILANVKNNSLMMLDSQKISPFNSTLQSNIAKSVIENDNKNSIHITLPYQEEVLFASNKTLMYCIINFLEEKLYGLNLNHPQSDEIDTYSQQRDIELDIFSKYGPSLFREIYISFSVSFLSFLVIIFIIFKNKQLSIKRAEKEKEMIKPKSQNPEDFSTFSFSQGSFYKTVLFLCIFVITFFISIIGISWGIFTDLIVGTLISIFYLVMFLTFYYFPDKAEITLWNNVSSFKYNLLKSLLIGMSITLNLFFQWNVMVHFLKLPFILSFKNYTSLYLVILSIIVYILSFKLPFLFKRFYLDEKLTIISSKFKKSNSSTGFLSIILFSFCYFIGILILSSLIFFPFSIINNPFFKSFQINLFFVLTIIYSIGFMVMVLFSGEKIYGIDIFVVLIIILIILRII
ncbi:MAG: membrane protein of unknown function [Promethearchaeota archaeon]|nr:MAG: membrane protein of unknown function [Candidatus Lokiarchaeota archaeon]